MKILKENGEIKAIQVLDEFKQKTISEKIFCPTYKEFKIIAYKNWNYNFYMTSENTGIICIVNDKVICSEIPNRNLHELENIYNISEVDGVKNVDYFFKIGSFPFIYNFLNNKNGGFSIFLDHIYKEFCITNINALDFIEVDCLCKELDNRLSGEKI